MVSCARKIVWLSGYWLGLWGPAVLQSFAKGKTHPHYKAFKL